MNIQTIVNSLPAPAVFLDDLGRVTVSNPAAEQAFGWTEREARGHTPLFIAADDTEHFFSVVTKVPGTAETRTFTCRCVCKDGNTCDFTFRIAPIRDVLGDGSAHLLLGASAPQARPASVPVAYARVPPDVEQETLMAAEGLARVLRGLSESLAPICRAGDAEPAGADTGGSPPVRSVSVGLTRDGTLDVHFLVPVREEHAAGVLESV